MALGCSTNTVLHVPAIAHEAGIDLTLDLFNDISAKTPHLCYAQPRRARTTWRTWTGPAASRPS